MSGTATVEACGLSLRDLARMVGVPRSTLHRAVSKGLWPSRGATQLRGRVQAILRERGATPAQLLTLFTGPAATQAHKEVGPAELSLSEAVPPGPENQPETKGEESMLLEKESLTPEARQHFNLPRDPFVRDVQTMADVFQSPSIRYVRACLMDCAQNHGFLAVVGESGAGKSTLAKELEERIKAERRDILVIRPYIIAMEQDDIKGKTLKSSHIAEAIAHALDPQLKVKSSPQARFAQVHDLLKASCSAGRRHLVLIEEAHGMPTFTLKQLKRFLEMEDGMQHLIGFALIAQPELRKRLATASAEVREVVQRLEIVELDALDEHLEPYLRHKFARFDLKYEQVFAPDAADAIRARLIATPRGGEPRSICHPLVVQNLVSRAMNAATRAGWPQVDAQVIAKC